VIEDERWMRHALAEAERADQEDEVPVGAVVVWDGRIIGRGHNRIEGLQDPTAHAEILAIGAAAASLKSWRLEGASIYVTVEPCAMCAGALVLSRMQRLVFGARDPKAGACGSVLNIVQNSRLNHRLEVTEGVLAEEATQRLQTFFRRRRIRKNEDSRKPEERGAPEKGAEPRSST
jgi:tRNA(adenine34) deaminase